METAIQLLNVWDNPVLHRFRRSQLRLKKSIAWMLLTLIITTFVVAIMYITQRNFGNMTDQQSARTIWIALLVIQGLIVLLKGTGKTAAGLIQDKIDQTLDYQRLTPVSPLRNVIGYLFGLPILEYVMFALTLPHLAFVVVVGQIPFGTLFSVYLIFFVCAIFYHMTAIAVGMVIKRWIWGYLLSIFSVAFLNLILPGLASQLGLKFLQYFSIFPVIGQKVGPLLVPPNLDIVEPGPFGPPGPIGPQGEFGPPNDFGGPPSGAPFMDFAADVPFFNWMLSPFIFTLMLQLGLIFTFATMAVRRWKKANKHSLSKTYSLAILGAFIVLVVGNLWPIITNQFLPFALVGITRLEDVDEFVAIGLPLVYGIAVWLLCLFLYSTTVPSHNAYIRGVRRAVKLKRSAARPWDDDSANLPFMSLFTLLALFGFWILFDQMSSAGFYDFLDRTGFSPWRLPLALGLVLFYSLLLLQVLEQRGMVLTILIVWLVPILVAIVMSAAMQDLTSMQTIIAAVSPLALLIMAGLLPLDGVVPVDDDAEFAAIMTGYNFGILFILAQIAFLAYRWQQLKKTLR